jgi:DNA repair protein RecN (Recombination protein N)
MLLSLSIKNYALIDDLEMTFSKGFTVITGETGAGKSILLGALSLLLGKRAETSVLADSGKKCIVEGSFAIGALGLEELFTKNDLDWDEVVYLRREIVPSGRSRAFVNDSPVNLQLMKSIGDMLVDVHSQHQTLMLGASDFQLRVLDDFVNRPELLLKYREAYIHYQSVAKKLAQLKEEVQQAKRNEDYYQFLYNELEAANLNEEAHAELIDRERFLTHAEEVMQGLQAVNLMLSEDDVSITERLKEVTTALEKVQDYLPEIKELAARLRSILIEMGDIASDVSRLNAETNFNPEEMIQVRESLDKIYHLQQKHRTDSISGLIALQEELEQKLGSISTSEQEIDSLTEELSTIAEDLALKAGELHRDRVGKSAPLARQVGTLLGDLGMKASHFNIHVKELPDFGRNGKDRVTFLFAANKGSKPGEISSIASGGELSRLMLAVKSLISREQLLPTVIFDEIDSGVSGDIAGKVGKILKSMSAHHQLIAISHLPQIAAKANHHLKVYKVSDEVQTFTRMRKLDEKDRVDEIAKLLSDEKVSVAAMETARELLNN